LISNLKQCQSESQTIAKEQNSKFNEPFVHTYITCDGCEVKPIVGLRYKCTVCADFDYCEKCEATKEHAHNFIKMKESKFGCPFMQRRGC